MTPADIVCLSHVPWSLALERPRQVMQRLACDRRVVFVEDPRAWHGRPRVSIRAAEHGAVVVSIRVPHELDAREVEQQHRAALEGLVRRLDVVEPVLWSYSPRAARVAASVGPSLVVHDCIDDRGDLEERALVAHADIVFAATDALFEAKRGMNVSTYPVPSGVEVEHFAQARRARVRSRARPRAGVLCHVDDRLDLDLLARVAALRPELVIDVAGPIAIPRDELPRPPNVRWLGRVPYADLPALTGTWDVALVPWRVTRRTTRLEPAGVLASLASGLAVVSTPLDAVVARHGGRVPVLVASRDTFHDAIDAALALPRDVKRIAIDALLARTSWDRTASVMSRLVSEAEMARDVARGVCRVRRPA
ncbi:MAG TPA: glycosyltransferase family 1 protein [Labilithrix sp.]